MRGSNQEKGHAVDFLWIALSRPEQAGPPAQQRGRQGAPNWAFIRPNKERDGMYRVIVMRHAKSSWKTDAPTDHARPLNKRGKRDAPRIARELELRGWVPQLVLSSDSKRTRQTFKRMRKEFEEEVPVEWEPTFYPTKPDGEPGRPVSYKSGTCVALEMEAAYIHSC